MRHLHAPSRAIAAFSDAHSLVQPCVPDQTPPRPQLIQCDSDPTALRRDYRTNFHLYWWAESAHRNTTVRTGPYTAVRELIPFLVNERRKTKRFEVSIGKPNREGLSPREIPGPESTASGVTRQPGTDPEFQQSCSTTTLGFPLPPQSSPKPQTHPADETNQHFGSFAKAEVTSPAPQIRN
jgi:hypothetical protein